MRLLALEMEGFRAFRQLAHVHFTPGLNVFAGPNESGKTSVLLGVVTAFFPPRGVSEREALFNQDAATTRVVLTYELGDGSRWRLERDLRAHRGSLARETPDGWHAVAGGLQEIVGEVRRHTGCDEPLLRSTLLIRHEQVEVGGSDDLARSLEERLETLVSGGPGGVSAARAARKLQATAKELTGPRSGVLAQARGRQEALQSRLGEAREAARREQQARQRLAEVDRDLAALDSAALGDSEAIALADEVARLEAGRAEAEAARNAIDRSLDAAEELEAAEAALAALGPAPPPVAADDVRPAPHAGRLSPLPAVAAGLVAMVLGTLAVLAGWWAVAAVAGVAAVGLGATAATIWRRRARTRRSEPRAADGAGDETRRRAAERRVDLARGAAAALALPATDELLATRSRLSRDLDEMSARLAEKRVLLPGPDGLAAIRAANAALPTRRQALLEERARLRATVERDGAQASRLAEAEDEAAAAAADVSRLEARAAALQLAAAELAAAVDEVRAGIGPRLAEVASAYLARVAPGHGVELAPGGFEFTSTPAGVTPSDGTADQFYFAVRLALAEVLLGDLRPPLLLDDPFRYADPARRAALHRLLEAVAADRQVLYFTVSGAEPLSVTHPLGTPHAEVTP